MKKTFFTLLIVCLSTLVFAQLPNTINYQAVARNASGQALANQTIKVRLSIVKNNVASYSETRTVTTNALGLFNVSIGSSGATNVVGTLMGADWYYTQAEPVKLKVELDLNNSNVFTDMGSQDLSNVPYAMTSNLAVQALTLQGYPVSSVAPQVGDQLVWTGVNWKPTTPVKNTFINLAGNIGSSVPASAQWAFLGGSTAQTTITVKAGTKIIAHFTAVLGLLSGGPANDVSIMPAYQTNGTGLLTSLNPGNNPAFQVTTTRNSYSVSSSFTFSADGTYKIGLAIRNNSGITLNNNDWVQGYYQIIE